MAILQALVDPIIPVFAILAFGFIMGRLGKASVDDARVINRFAMAVLLPILSYKLVAQAPIYELNPLSMVIYAGSEALVFTFGYLLASRLFKRSAKESVLLAFCGIFANNAFYGLPISILLYGPENALPVTSIVAFDTTVVFAGAIVAMEMIDLGRVQPAKVAATLARSPMLVAIAAGLITALTQLTIPAPLQTFLDFNGAAAPPVALFALGVVLSQTRISLDGPVLAYSTIKILIFPFVIWLGFEWFGQNIAQRQQFLLGAAAPSGAMGFVLALHYRVSTQSIAQIIIVTSVVTLLSLALLA